MKRPVARISEALKIISRQCRDDSLGCLTIFLCVCEYDGICIKDIVHRCGFSEAKTSRSVETLRCSGKNGLVDVHRHPTDGRKRLVYLTEDGQALRAEMEHLFNDPADA